MAEPDSPADPTGAVADSNDSSQTSFFQDRDPRAGEAGHDSSVRDGKRLRHRQEGYWLDRVPVEVRESLLSTMVNAANTMITLSEAGDGPDHPLVYVNRYFCEFTGYEPEEVLGRDCRFLQFRNGRRVTEGNEAGRLRISTALKDRNYERVVIRNFKKNGEEFANELYLSPMEDDGGVVRYYVGVQNDVTRQVRLIEKLRKSEASLSAAFASCPTGLALVERIDDGSATHLRVSEFAARLLLGEENGFGRGAADEGAASSPSELIDRCLGRSLDDLNLGGPVVDWLQTAFDQLSQAKPPAEPLRVRLEQAIGGRMRRLAVAAALVDQKDDGTSRFCYIIEDLTDLEALEADLALMRAAVHQTDVPTLLLTPDLGAPGPIIQYANPAAASLLGYAVEELTGEFITTLYGAEADPDAPARLRSALRQTGRFHGESSVQRADGSSLTVMWDVSAVRDGDGTPTHFAATLRDLRDQRALEARVLNAQTREQARIARDLHDGVAQQLAGLDMLCGLLTAQAADGEDVTETVEHIAGAVRGAARDLRGVAHGLMPLDEDRVGLTKGLKRLAKLTTEIGTARCAFETPDGPVLVADFSVAHHLYRIAQEALGNAIRHGGAANVTITLATRDADLAELIVDDDGTGFDPAAEEADARSDDARLRRDYGDDEEGEQGMGLSAMRFRARSIHGRLRFERRDSGGMRVACTFPHVRDATPQDA